MKFLSTDSRLVTRTAVIASMFLMASSAFAQCRIPQCSYGDYRAIGMAIDGYLEGGLSCLRDVREVFESGNCGSGKTNYFRVYAQLQPNSNGSWNKPPMSWIVNALDTNDTASLTRLEDYTYNQRDSAYGLWGKEMTSWMYWGPLPSLAAAYQEIPSVRPALRPLMQAHVGFLSLFSTGDRVLTPSMRTKGWNGVSDGQNYFLKKALGLAVADPNLNNDGEWDFRISKAVSHHYMAESVRDAFRTNFLNGSNISWVVAKLNALGVTSRGKIHIWRYQNGDFATLIERNLNGNDPPIYAVTRMGGVIRTLGMASSNSSPAQCYRENTPSTAKDLIHTSFGTIDAPDNTLPLVYYVTIDSNGVTRVQ